MNELTLRQSSEIASEKDRVHKKIGELIDSLIDGYNMVTEEKEGVMVEFYRQFIINRLDSDVDDMFPEIEDIMNSIYDYNNDILYEIAMLDLQSSYTEDYSDYEREFGWDSPEEAINEIFCMWQEQCFDGYYFNNVAGMIADIFAKHKLFYFEENNSQAHTMLRNSGLQIVYNDCQNFILKEWITEGLKSLPVYDIDSMQVVIR